MFRRRSESQIQKSQRRHRLAVWFPNIYDRLKRAKQAPTQLLCRGNAPNAQEGKVNSTYATQVRVQKLSDYQVGPDADMVGRPQIRIVFRRLIETQTRCLNAYRF